MSTANHGHGGILSFAATAIGNVLSISGPSITVDSLDISTMGSTGKEREFIPGMIDNGEITAELNYDGSSGGDANVLNAQVTATAAQALVIQFGDHTTPTSASKFESSAFITALGAEIPFDGKVTQSVTFKLTGQKTYTDLV
jgi:predicted secreted protein